MARVADTIATGSRDKETRARRRDIHIYIVLTRSILFVYPRLIVTVDQFSIYPLITLINS